MPKYDLPVGAIGLLLAIRNGLPVYTVDGVVVVRVRGRWYKSDADDVNELERRKYINIDEGVTLTRDGAYWAKRYAGAAQAGLIDFTPPEEDLIVVQVDANGNMERA